MSESKLFDLQELGKGTARDGGLKHSQTRSSRQDEPQTDKIVKCLKLQDLEDDLDTALNDRDIEASIVIKPTLKNQPKLGMAQRDSDNIASSRILKIKPIEQAFDNRASLSSSNCNILESSRTGYGKAAGDTTNRRNRYGDDDTD